VYNKLLNKADFIDHTFVTESFLIYISVLRILRIELAFLLNYQ